MAFFSCKLLLLKKEGIDHLFKYKSRIIKKKIIECPVPSPEPTTRIVIIHQYYLCKFNNHQTQFVRVSPKLTVKE